MFQSHEVSEFCFQGNSDEDDVTMQIVDYCLGSANLICQNGK